MRRWAAVALVAASLAGCAASGRSTAPGQTPPETQVMELGRPVADVRADIAALDATLDADAQTLALGRAADGPVEASWLSDPLRVPLAACPIGSGATCQDVCTIGERICEAAGRICDLAAQLPSDAWAQGRCAAGKETCDTARARCCGCA